MKKVFYIIAGVHGKKYITKVKAESACSAEHIALDRGTCGRHEYGCDSCMAYDSEAMRTDCFIGAALDAEPVSLNELMQKIDENNDRIEARDEAEAEAAAQEKRIKELESQIEEAKKALAEANKILLSA